MVTFLYEAVFVGHVIVVLHMSKLETLKLAI